MRISELLQKESIALGRKPQDKADAIGQMVELLAKSGSLEDKKKFKQAILESAIASPTNNTQPEEASVRALPFHMAKAVR